MLCPYCRTENAEGATRCASCTSWMVARPPVREWTRAREGRMIAGVCQGLADRFAIPVAALRLAFLLSLLLGGWGLILYVAFWIAMPYDKPALLARPTHPTIPAPPTEAESRV